MAQLPPKILNDTTPSWPEFSQQKIPSIASFSLDNENTTNQNPSWVDEFLNFSAARRSSRRRSISNSITFLEVPTSDHCQGGSATAQGPGNDNEFQRYNDEQFMSMFNVEIQGGTMGGQNASSSNPSSPSDHDSMNGEKESQNDKDYLNHNHLELQQQQQQLKNEPEEEESECHQEGQTAINNNSTTASNDRVTDPKRVKRILANRQSAQRSRLRKLRYISELERSVTSLQAEVSVLSPRVAFLDHQRLLLNVDNSALQQRIATLAQDKIFKDAHQDALKKEIERLRKIFHQQNIKKMEITKQSLLPSPTAPSHEAKAEMEQLNNT